jgi:tetratricopeptide (TPR) repeat protein
VYESYQQATYCDGHNPSIWNVVGELYFQINQFHDAWDTYSHGVHISPYISELWFNLGKLYENLGNPIHISDVVDTYSHARELEPSNLVILQRLKLLAHRVDMDGANSASATSMDREAAVDSENAGSDIEGWNENEAGSVTIANADNEEEDSEDVGSGDDIEEGRSENEIGVPLSLQCRCCHKGTFGR